MKHYNVKRTHSKVYHLQMKTFGLRMFLLLWLIVILETASFFIVSLADKTEFKPSLSQVEFCSNSKAWLILTSFSFLHLDIFITCRNHSKQLLFELHSALTYLSKFHFQPYICFKHQSDDELLVLTFARPARTQNDRVEWRHLKFSENVQDDSPAMLNTLLDHQQSEQAQSGRWMYQQMCLYSQLSF